MHAGEHVKECALGDMYPEEHVSWGTRKETCVLRDITWLNLQVPSYMFSEACNLQGFCT